MTPGSAADGAQAADLAPPRTARLPARLRRLPRMPWGTLPALLIVLPPLLWLAVAVIRAAPLSGRLFPDPTAAGLFARSLQVAGLTTALALLAGLPYGWLTARYRGIGGWALTYLSLLPLLLPPYAAGHAWSLLLTRDGAVNQALLGWGWIESPISPRESLPVAALVLASSYWPVVAWFVLFAARSVPPALEDAARLHLPEGAAARWSAWPAVRRSLPAALLLVFLIALADFGVPTSLGLPLYPVDIVNEFQKGREAGVVARLALPLLVVVVPLVLLQSRLLASAPVAAGPGMAPRLLRSGLGARLGAGFCWLVVGVSVLLPLGVLAAGSLPVGTYAAVWAESQDHLLNTLLTAGGGAALATALALAYVWGSRRRRLPLADTLLTLPYALPGSLIGVAMVQLLGYPFVPEWLYGTQAALVWTYAAFFFPFAYWSALAGWGHVDATLLDEAAVLGAGAWTQFRTAAWPVLRPYAVAGGTIVALLAARELDATALLRIPGGDTVAFRIHDLLHFAPGPNVAAFCVLLVALSAVAAGAAMAWGSRSPQ